MTPDLFGNEEERPEPKPKRRRIDFPVSMPFKTMGCDTCGERIVFQRIAGRSNSMPLHLNSAAKRGETTYMESHYAHCPQAEQWRRDKAKTRNCHNKTCAEKVPKDSPFCSGCWARLPTAIRYQIRERFHKDAKDELEKPSELYWTTIAVAQRYLDKLGRPES